VSAVPGLPAIYAARLVHLRQERLVRRFTSRVRPWLVDVDDLPHWPLLATFVPRDHLGRADRSIRRNVEACLSANGAEPPGGRILMLTTPRTLGYAFNPLTVYWCQDDQGRTVYTIAEVHNTHGERHCYLLRPDEAGRARAAKEFYVSPFFEVAGEYRMRLPRPGDRLALSVVLYRRGRPVFTASLTGRAEPASRTWAARGLAQPHRVRALIQLHGVALWLRRLPVTPHRRPVPRTGAPPAPHSPARAWVAERLFRHTVARLPVRVRLPDGESLGLGGPSMSVTRREFFHRLGARGNLGLGEAYVAGDWTSEDPTAVLTRFAARLATANPLLLRPFRPLVDVRRPPTDRNTPTGAHANIRRHYDLSNDLFAAFLDESMTYSSGWFHPGDTLHDAQLRKIDAVLDYAGVGRGSRVLEIGTGWGALAIRAARRGAHVTTLTISENQRDLALRRIALAGVADRVEVLLCDYRSATGEFDAVVSVEMVEAVGAEFWPAYFATLDRVLADDGRVALQAITMPHERMLTARRWHSWINEYVFPGGQVLSVPAIEHQVLANTGLRITARRRLGEHYARTLRCWRERFLAADLGALGFEDGFRRLWEFYLSYTEAGFASGYLDVWQFRLERRKPRLSSRGEVGS
jgi:cyclopropane fatty-acyl-phospholipid synthase-like methyltransferase/DUF1365 family protein